MTLKQIRWSALGLVLLTTGCAFMSEVFHEMVTPAPIVVPDNPQPTEPEPQPSGESMIVTPGIVREREVKVPFKFSFDIAPGDLTKWTDSEKAYIVWVYKGEFTGGRDSNTFEAGLRTYKVKAMWGDGLFNEPRYGMIWQKDVPVHIIVTGTKSGIVFNVNGADIPIACPVPDKVTIAIGWPRVRPAVDGSAITNIKWPEGQ